MEIGDKKKATILAAVAVGALLFLAIRLIPSGPAHVQATADRVAASTTPPAAKPLPLTLIADPFSHPSLARQGEEKAVKHAAKRPAAMEGALPGARPDGPGSKIQVEAENGDAGNTPVHPPGEANSEFEPPEITVQLTATMSVDKRVAVIDVNDKPLTLSVGGRVAPGISVKTITDDNVVLLDSRTKKKAILTLSIGQKKKL